MRERNRKPRKLSTKCSAYWGELKILTLRDLPTTYHKQAWENYEEELEMRTFCCLIARNVFSVLQIFSKLERYDYTERIIEEGEISNLQLVEDIYPYAKVLLQIMLCARFMLLLAVFKWRRLVKYTYYLDITV